MENEAISIIKERINNKELWVRSIEAEIPKYIRWREEAEEKILIANKELKELQEALEKLKK